MLEPAIVTVHASGGRAMMEDAKAAAGSGTKVVAVTMLTSLDERDLERTGVSGSAVGDQKRVVTPRQARDDGASVLVIGRPISRAEEPAAAARAIEATL